MSELMTYPLIVIRNTVVFPSTVVSLVIGRKKSIAALEEARAKKIPIVVATQKTSTEEDPQPEDIYKIGTFCDINVVKENKSGGYQIVVRGVSKFGIAEVISPTDFYQVTGEHISDAPASDPVRLRALLASLKELAQEVLSYMSGTDKNVIGRAIDDITDPSYLANLTASYLNISTEQKQELLEDLSVEHRIESLITYLIKERDVMKIQQQIHDKMSKELTDAQRKALLRQQLQTIKNELGESEDHASQELEEKLKLAQMPDEVEKIANEELERLKTMSPQSSEYHVIRNYLELLAEMPWQRSTKDEIDIEKAKKILDEDHYGLDEVKKRILEFLSVAKLKNDLRGPILCLLGPPGVGKTSLGQSIARVLGRKFIRASLGGVRDEAEIRGHRRTYIGALPGRIIQAIKRVGVNNPLFMLDEIDKLGMSYQGDPASSLLEVLDPEQNKNFLDHYLDVPFDLSSVFFIATANVTDTIPGPLLDRMEVISLSGYTSNEKLQIAKRYILSKQLKEHGLNDSQLVLTDEILNNIITHYTREAGVRELQRQLATLCRWVATNLVSGQKPPFIIKPEDLLSIFGPEKYQLEISERTPVAGVATGLAWTAQGGDILFIEASIMKGSGQMILTGQLGDVMKESARIAMSIVRESASQLGIELNFEKHNIHIHVPSGAIPKDGPSAGVTILTALTSLITQHNIDPKLAMTGEITLRGAVLPVGGIKEKVLAAHRAGITKIILPRRNEKDLYKIPEEVKNKLQIFFVDTTAEVLNLALGIHLTTRHSPVLKGDFSSDRAI